MSENIFMKTANPSWSSFPNTSETSQQIDETKRGISNLEKVRGVSFSKIEWTVNSTFHFVFARRQISNGRQLLRGIKKTVFFKHVSTFYGISSQSCFACIVYIRKIADN